MINLILDVMTVEDSGEKILAEVWRMSAPWILALILALIIVAVVIIVKAIKQKKTYPSYEKRGENDIM